MECCRMSEMCNNFWLFRGFVDCRFKFFVKIAYNRTTKFRIVFAAITGFVQNMNIFCIFQQLKIGFIKNRTPFRKCAWFPETKKKQRLLSVSQNSRTATYQACSNAQALYIVTITESFNLSENPRRFEILSHISKNSFVCISFSYWFVCIEESVYMEYCQMEQPLYSCYPKNYRNGF